MKPLPACLIGFLMASLFFVGPSDRDPDVYPRAHAIFDAPELRVPVATPHVAIVTAYCPCEKCCGRWAKFGLTRIGVRPRQGWTVAADPRVFPLRSCVLIDGKKYRVQDTGSAIKGARIDVFFSSHETAAAYAVKRLSIEPWVC